MLKVRSKFSVFFGRTFSFRITEGIIEEINDKLEIEIPVSEEYDTISGYIQDKLGKVAEVFDQVKENNFILKVTDVDNKRVERVRAIIIEQKEDKKEVRRENGRD